MIQKGDQLWKLRKRHGPERKFPTAEDLWKLACKYFEWCDNNPLIAEDVIRSGERAGEKIYFNKMRPYTNEGLCIHLGVSTSYFRSFKSINAKNAEAEPFFQVIEKVQAIIYTQKFEGAAAGLLNANIIARDLGLTDKKELDHKGVLIGKDLEDYIHNNKKSEDEVYE